MLIKFFLSKKFQNKKIIKKNVKVDQDITVKGISNVYKELL